MTENGKKTTVATKASEAKSKPFTVPFKKPKNTLISFEDLKEGKQYAFSYNPKDCYQSFNVIVTDRIREFYRHADTYFKYKNFSNKKLYVELSPKGRLHYHGIIEVEKVIEFFLYEIPSLLRCGTVCIKEFDDKGFEGWMKYCNKQCILHKYIGLKLALPHPIVKMTDTRFNLQKTLLIEASEESIEENDEEASIESPTGFSISDDMARPLSIKGRKKASITKKNRID